MEDRKEGSSQILQELDALSHSLYQAHTARRTASLALPRSSVPDAAAPPPDKPLPESRPRSRRLSMSPWRSRPKSQHHDDYDDDNDTDDRHRSHRNPAGAAAVAEAAPSGDKKGIWNWKPMRALSHIGMQRLGCLFSVEVVAVQGLPASMNGLRLSVSVRKKETKDGAVQTMPARVLQGSADFEETLFVRCHVYCSAGAGKPLKLEPRLFVISAVAIDAPELDFGRSTVDLSLLVKESVEKSLEGTRVRQWDASFPLVGKAKGGELALKLGFQIIEDGGVGIYSQADDAAAAQSGSKARNSTLSFSFVRKRTKSSFSVASPKITRSEPSSTPTKALSPHVDLKGIDEFSLDEPGPSDQSSTPVARKPEPLEPKDDLDLPEFEVVDKGIEIQEGREDEAEEGEAAAAAMSAENADTASASSEVVKEVVHDSAHLTRLTELDAIAQQIKALESMMIGDEPNPDAAKTAAAAQDNDNDNDDDNRPQQLDAEEETVTREFLQMLELEGSKEYAEFDTPDRFSPSKIGARAGYSESESGTYISDLGKGLGSVVQTRDGGFLAATNPFDVEVARKDPPKLAMQLSKPFVLADQQAAASGFEVFQRLAAVGPDELSSKLSSLAAMDELTGKTAEQIAFEGMASAIISGRSKEGASSSAARSVAALKTMAAAMSEGRRERILTGIWNVPEEPVPVEEILAFSLQKIEVMAIDALKIQADMAEEQAPFDVSPLVNKQQSDGNNHPLDSAVPPEEWGSVCAGAEAVTVLVAVQLRDPLRRYETVGAPAIAVIQAARAGKGNEEEGRFKVGSLHVGGLRLRAAAGGGGARRSAWDGERQRLTAMQWLVAYGLGKKGRTAQAKGGKDVVWSMSARVMADMWLKPMRNPDVKITEQ